MKKRADGRYLKQVIIGYTAEGKPKYKNIYVYSQAEVNNRAELLKSELNKGIAVIDDITLGDWSDRWFALYKTNVATNTQNMYKNIIKVHIKPNLGNMTLKSIQPHHLQGIVNNLLSESKKTTARQFRLTMRQILKSAIENNFVYKNVADSIKLPKIDKPKKQALTETEKQYVENANLNIKQRLFLSLLLYAGLRRGEALALSLDDFDMTEKSVSISKTVIYSENNASIKPMPKSEAGIRTIPLPDKLFNIVLEYIESDFFQDTYLFTMKDKNIMSNSSFRKFWESIIKELKNVATENILANDITPHMFRHTYATSLYYAGIDIKTAQYLLGHSSIQMTLDIYTHLETLDNSKISEKLNAIL